MQFGDIVIYQNSLLANHVTWTLDLTPEAPEVARTFLRAECQILRLASVARETIDDVERFLTASADVPLSVHRSSSGDLLIRAGQTGDDLMITGKTAEVLTGYIDREVVRTEDRLDMTLRRSVRL